MDELRQAMAAALTVELRETLDTLSESPEIMARITAPSLLILNRMKKSIEVGADGVLRFKTTEHELAWRKWQFGTSKVSALPLDRMLIERILDPLSL